MTKILMCDDLSIYGNIHIYDAHNATSVKNLHSVDQWGRQTLVSVDTIKESAIEWSIEVIPGNYELWVRYAAAESRPVEILVDEDPVFIRGLTDITYGWTENHLLWVYQGQIEIRPDKATRPLAYTRRGPDDDRLMKVKSETVKRSLRLKRSGAFPHLAGCAILPAVDYTDLPDVDTRAAMRNSARPTSPTNFDGPELFDFIKSIEPILRPVIARGTTPKTIQKTLDLTTDAIITDLEVIQARIGFSGPLNGQLVRQGLFRTLDIHFQFDVFVETGTYRGTTTEMLANLGRPVYGCELNDAAFYFSAIRLARLANVLVLKSDSRAFLRWFCDISVQRFSKPFFYLDAHWHDEFPLPEEIEIIADGFATFVIMVDDFKHPHFNYGYDRYSGGAELTLEYILPRLNATTRDRLTFFFPTYPPSVETGARRGTLVIAPKDLAHAIQESGAAVAQHCV